VRSREARRSEKRSGKRPPVERSLRAQLFDDEEVLVVARPGRLATFPRYLLTLGLYGLWRKRDTSTVTDRRILLGKGIVRRDERSIPLRHVDDVTVARRGVYSYADLRVENRGVASVKRVGPMTTGAAHRFAREILRRL
jgi:hypothetical protein